MNAQQNGTQKHRTIIRTLTLMFVSALILANVPVSQAAPFPVRPAFASPAQGQPTSSKAEKSSGSFVKHIAVFTIIDTGTMVGSTLPADQYTTIDSVKNVKCSNSKGCTIGFETMIELISKKANGNDWQIAAYVDGVPAANNPEVGVAFPSYYTVANTLNSVAVAQGSHTLSVKVAISHAATLEDWQVNYTLYEP